MPSHSKLPPTAQLVLLIVSSILSLLYMHQSERPLQLDQIAAWGQAFFGENQAHLEPRIDTTLGALPLIDYGSLQFVGCDLSLNESLNLVTNWRGVTLSNTQTLSVRFVLPTSFEVVDRNQAILTNTIFTSLPQNFYTDYSHGEIWLQVLNEAGQPLVAQGKTLLRVSNSGWIQICQ